MRVHEVHTTYSKIMPQKLHQIFQPMYKVFFITYSLHSLCKPLKVLENCFYGLLIFPITFINTIQQVPSVILSPKIAIVTILDLLVAQFTAFNFLIFGKIRKPKLKLFFIQTDELISQMEAHTNSKIISHNYFCRKIHFKFASIVIFSLIYLIFYLVEDLCWKQQLGRNHLLHYF